MTRKVLHRTVGHVKCGDRGGEFNDELRSLQGKKRTTLILIQGTPEALGRDFFLWKEEFVTLFQQGYAE